MTVVIFALLGGVVGGALLGAFGGFVLGAVVGAVAGWVADLAGRVRLLERRLGARAAGEARPSVQSRAAVPAAPQPDAAAAPEPLQSETRSAAPSAAALSPLAARGAEPAAAATPAAAPARRVKQLPPSAVEVFLGKLARWFTTGNVPVKVGVVLSLFGVGFLVKEGIDRQWLVLPLELRLVLVALFGIGLLVLGWRLRERQRVYALSVQGGGIGVLYLTIYASFALYDLLPAPLAFGLLVAVTASAGVLAVAQDARSLAVLGIVGGFMAPVLVSSDSGNHVALFSYYALLNVAIVGIAWFKAWRALNVLGFAFTFGIGTLWGANGYRPEVFATTEPFLILFTLMYLVIPVLFATRAPPNLRGFVDGTLLFGTPIVAFGLQSRLVADMEYGLAISAVALALIYIGMATYLYRSRHEALRVLIEAQLALSVAFVTVAVPLALDARWTSAAWALQGAALVWLAVRQQRKLALLAGLALQALSGAAYVEQAPIVVEWPVVNGYCLGALLLALAGFFSARLLDPQRARHDEAPLLADWLRTLLSIALLVWAGAWWFFGGLAEVERTFGSNEELAALLLFAAGTTVLAMFVAERVEWSRLNWLGLMLWPFAALGSAVALFDVAHPAEHFGWLAWPGVVAAMLVFLRQREAQFPLLRGALHALGFWLAVGLIVWQAHWLVERVAGGVWPEAVAHAVAAALALGALRASAAVAWPFVANARAYVQAGCGAVLAALAFATIALNVGSAGEAAPLPYVPFVNPLELASALVVLVLLKWFGGLGGQSEQLAAVTRYRPAFAAAAAWFLVTMTVARTVHHWAAVPYDLDSLAASTTFQSALSIVWGVGGLAGMMFGARSARRSVWLAGAALMAIVVAKLFLVDLGNTGTLARVVSFLGVGVLLLVVGYFAPVPPRAEPEARAASL
jgi:uncharacterized membrane protein